LPRSSAPRFHVDGKLAVGTRVELPAAVAHHALRVLRLRAGDALTLFDGRGGEYAAQLDEGGQALIEGFDAVERESPLALTLIQALIANDKLDWVIEKAVELGAARILIAPTERSVIRLAGDRLARRQAHWREIVVAACCQCGRNRLPEIAFASSWRDVLASADAGQRFVLAPDADDALASAAGAATAIAIGPEGGLTATELKLAVQHGFRAVHWGPRVLRTETAGLAALAALQTLHGDGARPAQR
jgi:16S rRNA (uracil1498-N3)-methyltransferase